jgi:hypothetical protein
MRKKMLRALTVALMLGPGLANAAPLPSGIPVAGSLAHPITPTLDHLVQSAEGGFWLGKPGARIPEIAVFLDPNCSICHRLYRELQPLVKAHKVAVWVVPVGVIQPTSLGKAAHLEMPFLSHGGKTAQVLLAENEAGHFQMGAGSGHISPVSDPKAMAMVQQHNILLERLTSLYAGFPMGRLETPVIVAQVHGKESVIFGAPPHGAAALVRDISR